MTSRKLIPKKDLTIITKADIGDHVGTRFGEAVVTGNIKRRAGFALANYNNQERLPTYLLAKQLRQSAKKNK